MKKINKKPGIVAMVGLIFIIPLVILVDINVMLGGFIIIALFISIAEIWQDWMPIFIKKNQKKIHWCLVIVTLILAAIFDL